MSKLLKIDLLRKPGIGKRVNLIEKIWIFCFFVVDLIFYVLLLTFFKEEEAG